MIGHGTCIPTTDSIESYYETRVSVNDEGISLATSNK